ncbi:MJ1477/TM1410 family putative glycoside hydrolase [Maridesulfovibrio sp. FT414]|uniref:MJ1477/TM1410 family putative glycoside hydrolase n=1 Tax=Maridesulfovibrio sp. FT414 TaxID=2979469 RepID=UPI003D8050C2
MKNSMITIMTIVFLISSCVSGTSSHRATQDFRQPEQTKTAIKYEQPAITSWAYVLQHPSIAALAESPYRLIVTDYSADGSDSKRFTAEQIGILHRFNKTVLCYFSIGEAEDYRFYWKTSWNSQTPGFLGPENENWAGNFKVRYWREDWWETALKPYLDRILEAGFDGVYLDIVDAYWFWHEQGMDIRTTADDMVKLIARIADYCRKRAGNNFIICPQNGMGIIEACSPEDKDLYVKTISMVGLESLLFNYYTEQDRNYRLKLAKKFADAGKTVLTVEYISKDQYAEYLNKVKGLDFSLVPYASPPDAALETLTDFWKYK